MQIQLRLRKISSNFYHSSLNSLQSLLILDDSGDRSTRRNEKTAFRVGRWTRMAEITMKNGRSKLPRVSLMLLALITPAEGFYSFIVLVILCRGFVAVPPPPEPSSPSLRFYDLISDDIPFKASSEFPLVHPSCSEGGNTDDYSVLF